jgi:hypothetical protein
MECLLGAPVPILHRLEGQSVFNPFSATNAQNQDAILSIGKIVLGVFVPIVVLIIALGVAGEKFPRVRHAIATCGGRCTRFEWHRLDILFGDIHNRVHGHPMVYKMTSFGAAMSIAACFAFVCAGIVLGVNSVTFPVYASSVSPQPAPWSPSGVFQLVVTVIGGGGIDQCAAGPANGFGIFESRGADWSVAPSRVPNLYNPSDGSCTLTWRCDGGCELLAVAPSTLQLRAPSHSWASFVAFAISTPLFASKTGAILEFGSAPFQYERAFYAPSPAGQAGNASLPALRGVATINLALTSYVVNSSSTAVKAVAFEPSLLGMSLDSVMTAETFDFNQTADGFSVDFVLSRNTLSFVFTASSSTVVTFLVLLSSVAGTMVGIFSVLVKQLENIFGIRDGSKSALEHTPQVDVVDTAGPFTPELPESIEMRDVRFTANRSASASVALTAHGDVVATKQHVAQMLLDAALAQKEESRQVQQAQEAKNRLQEEKNRQLENHNHQLERLIAELIQLQPATDRARLQSSIASLHAPSTTSLTAPEDATAPAVASLSRADTQSTVNAAATLMTSAQSAPAEAAAIGEQLQAYVATGDNYGYGQMHDDE